LRDACDESGELISFTTTTSTGAKTKTAVLGVGVKTIAITRDDVEQTWPPLQCEASVQSCLDALPSGATDAEACGAWYPVTRCALPWRSVQLFSSPDDLTALVNARASVTAALPQWKQVNYRAYGAQDFVPNTKVASVLNGWKRLEPYGDLVDTGPRTAAQVKTELTAFGGHAETLITATQQTVLQQSFVAQRYERANGTIVMYALWFSGAARLTVLETIALQP